MADFVKYQPKTWVSREFITKTDMNHLEEGVELNNNIIQEIIQDVENKVDAPALEGTTGQILQTNGDGTTSWINRNVPTDEQIAEAVSDWLDAHPEATTTVEDGAITYAKLDTNLQASKDAADGAVEDVASLKSAFDINTPYAFVDNKYIKYDTGEILSNDGYKYTTIDVSPFHGGYIKGATSVSPNTAFGIAFYDNNDIYIPGSGAQSTNTGSYLFDYNLLVPNTAKYMRISLRKANDNFWKNPTYPWVAYFGHSLDALETVNENSEELSEIEGQLQNDAGLTVGPYIDELNEKILTLKKSINILDTSATGWEEGGISSTGSIVATGYEGNSASPYIPVTPGLTIVSTRQVTADSRILFPISVGFYDGDKNFISPRQTSVSSVSVPAGAVYMRISGTTAYLQTRPGTYKPMLNYGSTIVDYEPYYDPYYEVVENWPHDSGEIVCWGDSLTYGSGSTSGNSYPDKLAQMTGKVVHKCGFPADSSDEIAGYQGSMPLVIAPVTIPASGSVNVDVYAYNRDPNGYPFGYPTIDAGNINPVTIAGIEGTLDLSAAGANTSNRTFAFTRSTSGSAVTLIDYTEVMPKNAIDRCKDIQIIWVGSNGGWDLTNSTLISQIRNMVEFQESTLKKYIVIGFAAGIEVSYAISFAKDATLAFGNHFIDMRDYLVRCGLAENGITPTEQDVQDITAGKVPSSLRINPYTHTVDSVHLNNAGYNSVASAVYTRGKILGYWG